MNETKQTRLKIQMLNSKTASWASKEIYIEKYFSVYGKNPTKEEVENKKYISESDRLLYMGK